MSISRVQTLQEGVVTHRTCWSFEHPMALVAANKSPPCPSYLQKTVTLLDWWLTSPETTDGAKTLGVAGLTSQQSRAARCFSSAPILKIHDLFELETVDGVSVILQGLINKDRTLQNGFSPQVFDHFIIGFPPNWKEFSTKRPKIESVLTGEGVDSIEGHGKPQSYTVDMGVEVGTTLDPSSVEIPHEEHIVAGNEVFSPGFEDDPSLNKSPTTGSKCLGSRRMTRSMKKMDNSKTSFPLVNDIISSLDKGTPEALAVNDVDVKSESSIKFVSGKGMKSKRKRIDQNVDIDIISNLDKGTPEALAVNDVDVKSESSTKFVSGKGMKSKRKRIDQNVDIETSQTGISNQGRISDLEEKHIVSECLSNRPGAGVIDDMGTNVKGFRNKKKSRVEKKLPVKRKLITTPKSTSSSRGRKGSAERHGSPNILSLESFSGKKSRSGRVVLPPLQFWRNQTLVYDEDGQVCGVHEPM